MKKTWSLSAATRRAALLILLSLVTPTLALAALDVEAVRNQLLDGVKTLADPRDPGRMAAFGPQACAVAWYAEGPAEGPMIAAAQWGEGRVIALPDHQWLNMGEFGGVADTGRFYRNGVAWLAGSADQAIPIVALDPAAAEWLKGQGYTNVKTAARAGVAAALPGAKVLVAGWLGASISQANLDAIKAFVTSGGGLFIADYGVGYDWWWKKPVSECPGNKLLRECGIGFGSGYSDKKGPFPVLRASGHPTADDVLALLSGKGSFDKNQQQEIGGMLQRLTDILPTNDPLLAKLDAECTARVAKINPTPATPVSDPLEKALLKREADQLLAARVEKIRAHRTAAAVYGEIPAGAPRVSRSIRIDTSRPRWHATGLYAAPGEIVTVTVPESALNKGFKVRVGGHTDSIERRPKWQRMPYGVARAFDVKTAAVRAACAFGGAIYIDLGERPASIPPFEVTVAGAVEAPCFVLGQTTDEAWKTIRNNPAPYAEMVSDNLAFSLPSKFIRALDNPTAVMAYWNRTVALEDDLCGAPDPRRDAERFDLDVEISAGYLHSGYPIMGPVSTGPELVDLAKLTGEGNWGYYHELGHNHQRPWWTFAGDTEVTENIFSNYCMETLAPGAKKEGWSWGSDPAMVRERAAKELAQRKPYAERQNRWAMWFQLADEFGWDAYKKFFRGYLASAPADLPRTEQEKKDQFLIHFSKVVNKNLAPWLVDQWGLEVSPAAVEQVKNLPSWKPKTIAQR